MATTTYRGNTYTVATPFTVIVDWRADGGITTRRYGFKSRREARDLYDGAIGAERVAYCALCRGQKLMACWTADGDREVKGATA